MMVLSLNSIQAENSTQHDNESELDVQTISRSEEPPMYGIVLHNDDYTEMEFVVWVLVQVLKLSVAEAYELMMKVHNEGYAVVAILPKEQAEVKVHQIRTYAEQEEFPLLVTLEKQ